MKALVWRGPGVHEKAQVPEPAPVAGEVLVRVELAGICGSDVTAHKGLMGISKPGAIRGHEFAGRIASTDHPAHPVGTRVSVDPVIGCGRCEPCMSGRPSSCIDITIVGVHRPGAFAELVAVPATQVHAVPDSLDWAAAASAEPLAQARHDVLRAAAVGALGRSLVVGAGSIGGWIVDVLRMEGAASITVVDPDERRHDSVLRSGAEQAVATDAVLAPASFDTVFDVVGIPVTRRRTVELTRNGGTVIAVGLGADVAELSWFDVVRREISVRGANTFEPEDFETALRWLSEGSVSVPSHRVLPLDAGGRVFDALATHADPYTGKTFLTPTRA